MPRLLVLSLLLVFAFYANAQDMISVRKKNGRSLKTFVAGLPIAFETNDGSYIEGPIQSIRNDSILVSYYDIRTVMTHLGVYVRDTVARYLLGFHYTDIKRVKLYKYRHFFLGKVSSLLQIGGAGYLALNIINGAYLDQPITSKENLKKLGISVGSFGLGLLLRKLFSSDTFSSKQARIVYLKLR